jgi:hypothetical protein
VEEEMKGQAVKSGVTSREKEKEKPVKKEKESEVATELSNTTAPSKPAPTSTKDPDHVPSSLFHDKAFLILFSTKASV